MQQRRFALPDKNNKRLENFLNEIYQIYCSALYTYNEDAATINEIFVDNIRGTEDYSGPDLLLCFTDLIDGRLLYRLAQSKALVQDEIRLGNKTVFFCVLSSEFYAHIPLRNCRSEPRPRQ